MKCFTDVGLFLRRMVSVNRRDCLSCGVHHSKASIISEHLCPKCALQVPWITNIECLCCGADRECWDCFERIRQHGSSNVTNRSSVAYTLQMKRWLAQYKFRGDERWAELLVNMMLLTWKTEIKQQIDIITFVPISLERAKERTFNQSERLATLLAQKTGLSMVPLLLKSHDDLKQSMRSRKQRLEAMKTAFRFNVDAKNFLVERLRLQKSPLSIMLVDDVYTTGATLHACAKILQEQVPSNCYALTWARS